MNNKLATTKATYGELQLYQEDGMTIEYKMIFK
jgi:hypothetical protein